jgi:hypothetical protein
MSIAAEDVCDAAVTDAWLLWERSASQPHVRFTLWERTFVGRACQGTKPAVRHGDASIFALGCYGRVRTLFRLAVLCSSERPNKFGSEQPVPSAVSAGPKIKGYQQVGTHAAQILNVIRGIGGFLPNPGPRLYTGRERGRRRRPSSNIHHTKMATASPMKTTMRSVQNAQRKRYP